MAKTKSFLSFLFTDRKADFQAKRLIHGFHQNTKPQKEIFN